MVVSGVRSLYIHFEVREIRKCTLICLTGLLLMKLFLLLVPLIFSFQTAWISNPKTIQRLQNHDSENGYSYINYLNVYVYSMEVVRGRETDRNKPGCLSCFKPWQEVISASHFPSVYVEASLRTRFRQILRITQES